MNLPFRIRRAARCMISALTLAVTLAAANAADFTVTTPGDAADSFYTFAGLGHNPVLTLTRGQTYTFSINTCSCHPFEILGAPAGSLQGNVNNISSGTITFTVPITAANYSYRCSIHQFGAAINTVAPAQAPSSTTQAATGVTGTGATLHASINPNGAATNASFVYGTDSSLQSNTNVTPDQAIGGGSAAVAVTATLTGLSPATTYYFQAIATNTTGTTPGTILSFATPSTDASLTSLTSTAGSLNPAFNPGVLDYSASVANSVATVTVTPTVTESHATVLINGTAVVSGNASAPVTLTVGSNNIPIIVTAQDGVTTQTYTLSVTRRPPSVLDTSFGVQGVAQAEVSDLLNDATCMVLQPDGKIVVAGSGAFLPLGARKFVLARFDSNGALDTTFNSNGKVQTSFGAKDSRATCAALQTDGKIVVAGFYVQDGTFNQDVALARYNRDGSLDSAFGTGGLVTTDFGDNDSATGIVVQSDGKILIGGNTGSGTTAKIIVARYTSDGSLDTTFDTDGKLTIQNPVTGAATANALALQRDGKIVLGGSMVTSHIGNFAVVRLLADGSLDSSFGGSGIVKTVMSQLSSTVRGLALQADGKIVAGGASFTQSGQGFGLARYNLDGSLDSNFGTAGKVTTLISANSSQCNALAVQADGKLLATGFDSDSSANRILALVRYLSNGTLDTSFNGTGIDATIPISTGNAVAAQRDGGILVAGTSQPLITDLAVYRFASGLAVTPFAWGYNGDGEVGDQTSGSGLLRKVPVQVNRVGALAGKTVVDIAPGGSHTVALCSDGTVACWGTNYEGELGNNTTTPSLTPVAVDTGINSALHNKTVKAIAAGPYFSLALCTDGTVAGWGGTGYGQLGTANQNGCLVPTAMYTGPGSALQGKTVIAIATGNQFSLMLCSDGTIAATGFNFGGQLGTGSHPANPQLYPVKTLATAGSALFGKTVVAIAAGLYHGMALCSDGSIAAWGSNGSGQLGDGGTSQQDTPVTVNAATGLLLNKQIVAIAAGGLHSLALCADGTIAAWGNNEHGQLGNGTQSLNAVPAPVAVDLSGVLNGQTVVSLAGSGSETFALCADGSLAAWGYNGGGAIGDNSTADRLLPVLVNTSALTAVNARFTSVTGTPGAPHITTLAALPALPEITVKAPGGTPLASGAGGFLFSDTLVGASSSAQTFTIVNDGFAPLTGLAVSKAASGTPSDFVLNTTGLADTLVPGSSTTFTVIFSPSALGTRSTILRIASNDADENPFLVTVSGSDPSSNANLSQLTPSVGSLSPVFDPANTAYALNVGTSGSLTFTPTAAASGSTIKVNGNSVVSGNPSGSISLDGGTSTINIVVTASDGVTTKSYAVTVISDTPEIAVEYPLGTNLVSGTSVADFGTVIVNTPTYKTFTVKNLGSQNLTGLGITFTGPDASLFNLAASPSAPVAGGGSTNFSVVFSTPTKGGKSAIMHIASNDANEPSFDVPLSARTHALSLDRGTQTVREDPTTITLPVRLSSAVGSAFTVPVTFGGSAVDGIDYTHSSSPLKFSATQVLANITITVKDNTIAESDKTVTVTLGAPSLADVSVVSPSAFTLTIVDDDTPPTISPVPVSKIVAVGDGVQFDSGATGSAPLTKQWKKNNVAIAGATGNSLAVTNAASLTDAGAYSFTASNTRATDTKTAQLAVVDTSLVTLRINSGATANLTAGAAGNSLTYQWRDKLNHNLSNGGRFSGATSKTLVIKSLQVGDAGAYTCVITAPGGTKTTGSYDLQIPTLKPIATAPTFPSCVVYNDFSYQLQFDTSADRAPTKFVCANLPSGLACNPSTGLITGKPKVPGDYTVIVTLSNNAVPGTADAVQGIIHVLPFPAAGSFVGLMERHTAINNDLGGRVDLFPTSTGSFTGTLKLGASSYGLTGSMTTTPALNAHPSLLLSINRGAGKTKASLLLDIDPSTGVLAGSVQVPESNIPAAINGWKNPWYTTTSTPHPVTSQLGLHSLELHPDSAHAASTTVPQGYSYAYLTVTAAGITTISGTTSDGGSFSSTGILGPNGEVPVYQLLYSNKGSILGPLTIAADVNHTVGGTLKWQKNVAGTSREYGAFSMGVDANGGKYTHTGPVLGLPTATSPNFNAQLTFTDGGIAGTATPPNVSIRISNTNGVTVSATNPGKVTSVTITTSATGDIFAGKFTLTDPVSIQRTVSFQGRMVSVLGKGYGYFMLPQLTPTPTTSPILSGKVVLE